MVCTLERKQQREPIGTSFILISLHIIINIIQPNIRYLLLLARAAAYVLKCTPWTFPLTGFFFLSNSNPTWNPTRTNLNKLEQVGFGVDFVFQCHKNKGNFLDMDFCTLPLLNLMQNFFFYWAPSTPFLRAPISCSHYLFFIRTSKNGLRLICS